MTKTITVEIDTDLGAWPGVSITLHAPSHVCLFQRDRRILISGDDTAGTFAVMETRAEQGHGSPMHVHRHDCEIFLVLEEADGRTRRRKS